MYRGVCKVTCCSKLSQLTAKDRQALNAWLRYEREANQSHTCLHELQPHHIEAFVQWLLQNKQTRTSELATMLRTAARRQGAEIPYAYFKVSGDLRTVVDDRILPLLSGREKTACRHLARFAEYKGIPISITDIDEETLRSFRAFLTAERRFTQNQVYQLSSHLRSAAAKGGAKFGTPTQRRVFIENYPYPHLIQPYIRYLRTRWKASTYQATARHYRKACADFVDAIAHRLGVVPTQVQPTDLLLEEGVNDWIHTVSQYADRKREVHVRAVTGLLAYWAPQLNQNKLLLVLEQIRNVLGNRSVKVSVSSRPSEGSTDLEKLAIQYIESLQLRGFTGSIGTVQSFLRRFLRWCRRHPQITNPQILTVEVMDDYLSDLVTYYTEDNSLNNAINITGNFWRWLRNRGLLPAFREGILPRVKPRIRPRSLTRDQTEALIQAVRDYDDLPVVLHKRNIALIVLGITTGPRGIELRNLTFDDFDLDHLWIRYHCKKGSRMVPLPEIAAHYLEEYIRVRPRSRFSTDRIFLAGNGAFQSPLGKHGFNQMFAWYRDKAGIPANLGGFHCLRHTFARSLADDKVPPLYIKELLGHTSLSATNLYILGAPHSGHLLKTDLADSPEEVMTNV